MSTKRKKGKREEGKKKENKKNILWNLHLNFTLPSLGKIVTNESKQTGSQISVNNIHSSYSCHHLLNCTDGD